MDKVLECLVWTMVYSRSSLQADYPTLRSPMKLKIPIPALSVTNNFNVLAIILKLR
ncbi:hypothetical protein [Nostoc sp. PCC 9305]|uniref:hypothetical protein n=1 Tax=Nostoc sp. PCC 9305 TaxID=296636 RepID=UPI0039C714CF